VFPEELVQEMHGLADGCVAANPQTAVTWERVVTLNFGFDFLLACVYAGRLWTDTLAFARERGVSSELLAFFEENEPMGAYLLKAPVLYCDAFGVRDNATASGAAPPSSLHSTSFCL
jgi:hypothetical protein